MNRDVALQQYFTPAWAAELIVKNFFPNLSANDVVVEPSCGDGRFLMAIPSNIEAFGVELDPMMAEEARANTGRLVIEGDFASVELPKRPTLIIGNPPFSLDIVDAFLERAFHELEYGGQAAFLLPVYAFQTASRVCAYAKRFSLSQHMIPRNLFPGLSKPLMWASFRKEHKTVMSGLFLYVETNDVASIKSAYRTIFIGNESRASVWGTLLEQALADLGGEATLEEVYAKIESNRPTSNPFWREQLRKVASRHCVRTGRGRYALHKASA